MGRRQLDFRDERRDPEEYLDRICRQRHPVSLLLDRLADNRNIGALFRIADAARLQAVYGYQMPGLLDQKKLHRVARGAENHVPYLPLHRPAEVVRIAETARLVALEVTNDSIPFDQYHPSFPSVLIVGNERHGVSPELLELAHDCIHIPMYGLNTSMNVAVATGIAVYKLLEADMKTED